MISIDDLVVLYDGWFLGLMLVHFDVIVIVLSMFVAISGYLKLAMLQTIPPAALEHLVAFYLHTLAVSAIFSKLTSVV